MNALYPQQSFVVARGQPNLEEVLITRAKARAHLWAEHMLELQEAVDELWEWALTRGLVDSLGALAVQQILSDAFAPWRDDLS